MIYYRYYYYYYYIGHQPPAAHPGPLRAEGPQRLRFYCLETNPNPWKTSKITTTKQINK